MYENNKYILKYEVVYDKMVSINEAYFHMPKKSSKNGRLTTYTTKTDKLKKLQEYFNEVLDKLISDNYIKIISDLVDTKFYGIKILTVYSMPYDNYHDSDVSNYVKNYEDCIATRLRRFNKNLDDKNNLEYRAIKRYRNSNSNEWKITTIIYPIERDIKYRSEILELYCINCDKNTHCYYNKSDDGIYCSNCNKYIGLKINKDKSLYGITKSFLKYRCDVCGSEINQNGICTYCGIDKMQYNELINNFNEEKLSYEE